MSTRKHAISFSAKTLNITLTMGLLMASSSAFAQEVAPTAPVAPVMPPPVEATVQPVTPPPVVRTLPNESDRVAPQAAAEVAAERTERVPARSEATAATPVRRAAAARTPVAAPAPSSPTEAVAPDAPAATDPVVDTAPVAPVEEPVTEIAQADVVPVNDPSTDNDWLLGAGIASALGLAGIALLASRRRRRRSGDVVSETAPVTPVTYAEPPRDIAHPVEQPIVRPTAAPVFAATTADPLFSRPRHDIPVAASAPVMRDASNLPGVTDPLFAHRAEQTPVTDPMFARKIEVPAITDPMFAKHPEFEGNGPDGTRRSEDNGSSYDRTRELEPAE